jgi:hypothetical protein
MYLKFDSLEKNQLNVAMTTKPIMQRACAAIATINTAALKNLGTALMKNFMPLECARTATSTCTIKKKEMKFKLPMTNLAICKFANKSLIPLRSQKKKTPSYILRKKYRMLIDGI